MQVRLWISVAACVAAAVASGLADRRRARRVEIDRVGIMPWPTIQFAALFGGIILAALALTG
ncbi:hypothetical protein [Sphingomonas sp. RS2018]